VNLEPCMGHVTKNGPNRLDLKSHGPDRNILASATVNLGPFWNVFQ